MWELAYFSISRAELHARIGTPHFTEINSSRLRGGDEDVWAFVSPGGQRLLLLLDVPSERAAILADPPDASAALAALSEATSGLLVTQFDRAYPLA